MALYAVDAQGGKIKIAGAGAAIVGPRGPQGEKGDTGEQGPPGPKGEPGKDGVTMDEVNAAIQAAVLDSWEGSY